MDISDIGPRRGLRAAQESLQDLRFENLAVQQLSPTIGAELHGIDLSQALSEDVVAEIKQALVAFKVIFFRDQYISTAQHIDFAGRFGELEEHPFLPPNTEFPELVRFDKDEKTEGYENLWHSDVSWCLQPSLGSVLRAIKVPSVGGDTLFSDMVAAYDNLDDETREAIDGRVAVHDFTNIFGRAMDAEALARRRATHWFALIRIVGKRSST